MPGFFQPDPYSEEQQRIQQNMLYAQQLQQQGLKPLQGQMVSGHYVAPSPVEGIAHVLQSFLGARGQNQALDQSRELSQRALSDQSTAMQSILSEQDPAKRVQASLSSSNPAARELGKTLMADMLKRQDMDYGSKLKRAEMQEDPSKLSFDQQKELRAIKPDDPNALTFDQRKELAQIRGTNGGQGPSNIQEWDAYQKMSPADKEAFLNMKRASMQVNLGDKVVIPSKVDPSVAAATLEKGLPPQDAPAVKGAQATATAAGTATGAASAELADRQAALPRLEKVAAELSALGKKATYTKAGQAWNAVKRQTGMDVGEGAVARTEYLSKIDNEVLPLLRQTFGAQFTQKEGESLKVTLGDPDKSPEEKNAVLKSFIESKKAQIGTGQRRTGQPPTVNAKGWQLHQDAQGNKAYVGPNGEVEEVAQ